MKRLFGIMCLVGGLAVTLSVSMADEKKDEKPKGAAKADAAKSENKEEKFTAKCPVSGSAAKKEQAAKYKEKEVYFCCEKCKAAFEKDSAKYSAKANLQLVQTKQFRQTQCPLSGGKINKEQFTKVEGVKVSFCCDKCKGTIEKASAEEQLAKVFADEVFTKAFAARKADEGKTEGKGGGKGKGKGAKKEKTDEAK